MGQSINFWIKLLHVLGKEVLTLHGAFALVLEGIIKCICFEEDAFDDANIKVKGFKGKVKDVKSTRSKVFPLFKLLGKECEFDVLVELFFSPILGKLSDNLAEKQGWIQFEAFLYILGIIFSTSEVKNTRFPQFIQLIFNIMGKIPPEFRLVYKSASKLLDYSNFLLQDQ